MKKTVAAIVPAAGFSGRMGGISKIFAPVNGLPLIGHTLRVLEECALIDEIIITARERDIVPISELCRSLSFQKISCVLEGGETRLQSVLAALMETRADIAAIHDGARPCLTDALCTAVIEKALQTGAAVPALPLTDSVKLLKNGVIKASANRSELFAVQTPQCFDSALVKCALTRALQDGLEATDDSAAVEALPCPVHTVPGETRNIKVTAPDDLLLVSAILRGGTL
jgi:2-C-methyl-D-erythritol 4-phosphate cytidylyltransferase